MKFSKPKIIFSDSAQGSRTVSVQIKSEGNAVQGVSVTFSDKIDPSETNADERARVTRKAVEMIQKALQSLE